MVKTKIQAVLQQVLQQAVSLVQTTVDNYLADLESHIGVTSSNLPWAPLEPDKEQDGRFWYETGAVAENLVVKVTVENGRIRAVAGLPSSAPGYQEAIWNEFGWMPQNSTKLVRRALFVPLAEHHIDTLNTTLSERFSNLKLNVRIVL